MSQFSRIHTRRIDPETGETIELRQPLLLFPPGSEQRYPSDTDPKQLMDQIAQNAPSASRQIDVLRPQDERDKMGMPIVAAASQTRRRRFPEAQARSTVGLPASLDWGNSFSKSYGIPGRTTMLHTQYVNSMLLELVRWNYDLLNITPKEGDPETYPLLEEDLSRISQKPWVSAKELANLFNWFSREERQTSFSNRMCGKILHVVLNGIAGQTLLFIRDKLSQVAMYVQYSVQDFQKYMKQLCFLYVFLNEVGWEYLMKHMKYLVRHQVFIDVMRSSLHVQNYFEQRFPQEAEEARAFYDEVNNAIVQRPSVLLPWSLETMLRQLKAAVYVWPMFKKHIPTRAALKDFVSFELLQELRRVIAGSTKMDDIATRISLMQTRAANSQDSRTLLQEAQVYGVATLGATYDLKNRIELAMENSNRSSANQRGAPVVNLTTLQTADFEQGQSAGMAEEAQGIDGDEDDQMEEDEDYEQQSDNDDDDEEEEEEEYEDEDEEMIGSRVSAAANYTTQQHTQSKIHYT